MENKFYPAFQNAWLSSLAYDLPDSVKSYKYHGDFAAETAEIDRLLAKPIPAPMRQRLIVERMLAEGMARDFSVTPEAAMAELRERYPALPDEAMAHFLDSGHLDWRLVGGELRLQDDAISNLRKTLSPYLRQFAPDAEPPKPSSADRREVDNIAVMRERGQRAFRFTVRETLAVREGYLCPGEALTVHLPFPIACESQSEIKLISTSHAGVLSQNSEQATVCFRETCAPGQVFALEYSYVSTARYTPLDDALATAELTDEARVELREEAPHIAFTPYLRALCAELCGNETNPLAMARAFYDYITQNVRYSYVRDYRIIDQLAEYPALNLRGDCGLQALMFITLCRIAGIPARWRSGSAVNPGGIGSHDWCEFYVAPWGWLPCDPSYGGGAYRAGDEARRVHYFGNLDPFRLISNRAIMAEFDPPKRYLRIDPYDNQSGEAEYDDVGGIPGRGLRKSREVLAAEEM